MKHPTILDHQANFLSAQLTPFKLTQLDENGGLLQILPTVFKVSMFKSCQFNPDGLCLVVEQTPPKGSSIEKNQSGDWFFKEINLRLKIEFFQSGKAFLKNERLNFRLKMNMVNFGFWVLFLLNFRLIFRLIFRFNFEMGPGGWKATGCGGWKAIVWGGWKATECGDCGC